MVINKYNALYRLTYCTNSIQSLCVIVLLRQDAASFSVLGVSSKHSFIFTQALLIGPSRWNYLHLLGLLGYPKVRVQSGNGLIHQMIQIFS